MKKVDIILKTDRKFNNNAAEGLRGYCGNYFRNIVQFHNHLDEISFNYKSSYIQYRVIDGELALLGIDEGADILLEHIEELKSIKLGEEIIEVKPIVTITFPKPEVTDTLYRYKFDTLWFALNDINYKKYIKGELSLDNQLRNNILEFFKMCKIWVDKRIIAKGEFKEERIIKKDTEILVFSGEFETNALLPDNISLGKRKSIGLGRIKRLK
ncbi:CRISPR-associated endonuclease Cas6 [Fusobacterium sp.]|uniref:CRISPR-associated endonuclease Cas6 n=1 Tax=Fusobacterium sp. TaxID=68766 RepID=UPI0025C158DB|nr:CRISPR-associated endonuclease Cas6 [Fusobacterium sp.]